MTDNLALSQVGSNQTQKEVTINDKGGQLDAAITENLAVDMSGGNVTLTDLQFRRNITFRCSGQTAARDLTISTTNVERGLFCVVNEDTTYDVNVKKGSTSIAVPPEATAIFSTDGTTDDLVKLAEAQAGATPVSVGVFVAGSPGNAELVLYIPFNESVTFPAGLTGSNAVAGVASAANKDFDVQKNGGSVGTISFNTTDVGTFTMASPTTFDPGDILGIIAPATADTNLADIGINLFGTK